MKKTISLLLALIALLLCFVGCNEQSNNLNPVDLGKHSSIATNGTTSDDRNNKPKLIELRQYSSMTLNGTTSIEVVYDYIKGEFNTYEFVIEDTEVIEKIMAEIFNMELKDYPKDRDINIYQRWITVKQANNEYRINLSIASDGENQYICQSQEIREIIEKYIEENLIEKNDTLSKPETALEFWIAENVDGVDFSKYQIKYGMMGGTEYYGTGYAPTVDEYGQQVDPKHCVIYTVTSYPDYSDKEQHVTSIYITDPEIELYGITLNSSFEDFESKIKVQGFEITTSNEYYRTAEKGKYSISITKEWIRIRVKVENKEGIIF